MSTTPNINACAQEPVRNEQYWLERAARHQDNSRNGFRKLAALIGAAGVLYGRSLADALTLAADDAAEHAAEAGFARDEARLAAERVHDEYLQHTRRQARRALERAASAERLLRQAVTAERARLAKIRPDRRPEPAEWLLAAELFDSEPF